ncbi:DUF4352 domain-containing protein [Nonomuraea sp. NPDC023979]|uniref:DUF4352 domain-containing protein n=1 Tax=Nonomuraea sp. NPDC023979 TaxID=3154796 RepID=UPI0033FC1143
MGYPQQPQDPYGQSGPQYPTQHPYGHSGPQPGYGYGYQPPTMPPPPPPRRNNTALIVLLAIGIPLLLLGGCAAVVAVLGQSASREVVVTQADEPLNGVLSSQPETAAPGQETDTAEPPASVPEEQPAGPSSATVGGSLTLEGRDPGLKMTVTVTRVVDPATPDQFSKPETGSKLVAIELTLVNSGQAVYDDSPTNGATLIDAEGQQYRSTYSDVREGQEFGGSSTINTGDTRKGVIVFEVPEKAGLGKFQFALDSGFADQKGEWTLS